MRLDGFGWARINDIVTEKPIYLVNGLIPGRRYRFRVITEDIKGGQSQGKETEIIQPFGELFMMVQFSFINSFI